MRTAVLRTSDVAHSRHGNYVSAVSTSFDNDEVVPPVPAVDVRAFRIYPASTTPDGAFGALCTCGEIELELAGGRGRARTLAASD